MGLFDRFKASPAEPPPRPIAARFAVDRARMFSLDQTQRLADLFAAPRDRRDEGWRQAFFDAAWYASIVVGEPASFIGPDGFPYFRFDLPRPNTAFDSQSLGNLARGCVERGAGAAIFASPDDPDDAAQFVFTFGMLDSLLRYDSPDGDPIDRAERAEPEDLSDFDRTQVGERHEALLVNKAHDVLVATPSAEFLPPYTARVLARYMTMMWGIKEPRVSLLIDASLRPTRNLVIGMKRPAGADAGFDDSVRRILWFLPRHRSIMLMPGDWDAKDMTRLVELDPPAG